MPNVEHFKYDNDIVRKFAMASVVFGIIGMTVGLLIALQMVFPALNFDFAPTTFGRLRPLHTNAVIFAFVGNGIFMGVYYSLQRLLKAPMFSKTLSNIHFWGWQAIILSAAITLPLGFTGSHEYAELEQALPFDDLKAFVASMDEWNHLQCFQKYDEQYA